MSILQFLALSGFRGFLKLSWLFLDEIEKDQTLRIFEKGLHNLLVEGGHSELVKELQDIYIWLLEH